MNRQHWSAAHERLKETLSKEVSTLRDLLGNLAQEEHFLSVNDVHSIFKVQECRAALLHELSATRKERLAATKALIQTQIENTHRKTDLETLLPQSDVNSSQVLSLQDQKKTLLERLNFQKEKNLALHHHWIHQKHAPQEAPLKKKSGIATLEEKR